MANPEVWGIVESNQCFFLVFVAHLQGILAALGTAAVSSGGFLLLLVTWQISIWYTPKTNMEPEKHLFDRENHLPNHHLGLPT